VSAGPAIISLATGDGAHAASLARLERSLDRVGFAGQRLLWWPGTFPDGCPTQLEVPFAFKPFCFAEAGARGIGLALWLDASCVAIRWLDGIFEEIEARGYVLFRHGRRVLGEWAGDAALAAFGLDRETAMRIPEVNAAAVGLQLDDPLAAEFLNRWHDAAREGTAFRGVRDGIRSKDDYAAIKWNRGGRASSDPRVRGHRHDQTVAGILAHQLGLRLATSGLQPFRRARRPIAPATAILVRPSPGRLDATSLLLGRIAGRAAASLERAAARSRAGRG
jgi:hypothetical protein